MDTLNIVLMSDTYWPIRGGVEETIRTLAAGLRPPFDPVIVTHAGPQPYGRTLFRNTAPLPFTEYADPAGRRVIPLLPGVVGRSALLALLVWDLPVLKGKNAPPMFDMLYGFYRKAYRAEISDLVKNASLVHCFSTGYLARCTAEACADNGVPLVLTPAIHFGGWGDSPGQIAAYASADAIICPTGYFKKQLLALTGSTRAAIEIIPPFIREPVVETAPPPGVAITEPFILFLGRREHYKGMGMLLDALSMTGCPAELVIAGPADGPPVRQKGVIDLGEVPEPVKQWLLDNCAFFCVPSGNESFGMVYAEAMQSGKPVVALDIPVMRELVEQGVSGLLVPPGDNAALASAVTTVLSDKDLQMRMGKAAGKRFEERYAGRKSMEKIVEIYKLVIAKKERKIKT
jgi:glycosyltransferase involved in cell wall biosynthesis